MQTKLDTLQFTLPILSLSRVNGRTQPPPLNDDGQRQTIFLVKKNVMKKFMIAVITVVLLAGFASANGGNFQSSSEEFGKPQVEGVYYGTDGFF